MGMINNIDYNKYSKNTVESQEENKVSVESKEDK